jgi:hypothetical protein
MYFGPQNLGVNPDFTANLAASIITHLQHVFLIFTHCKKTGQRTSEVIISPQGKKERSIVTCELRQTIPDTISLNKIHI